MIRSKKWNSFVAVLCIIIIVAYASVMFISHTHECVGDDCTVCAIIETSRSVLIGLALSAVLCQLTSFLFVIPNTNLHIESVRDGTPVGLKVKLSD